MRSDTINPIAAVHALVAAFSVLCEKLPNLDSGVSAEIEEGLKIYVDEAFRRFPDPVAEASANLINEWRGKLRENRRGHGLR